MSTHLFSSHQDGSLDDAKIRAAVEAALAGKKLPRGGLEPIVPGYGRLSNMPVWGAAPRALSADSPSNPFPGVPVIAPGPVEEAEAPVPPAAVANPPAGRIPARPLPVPTEDALVESREDTAAAGEQGPVTLTEVPGASLPSTPESAVPISEIAARAAHAVECNGSVLRVDLDQDGDRSSGRSVPMLGELSAKSGRKARTRSRMSGDGTGDLPPDPDTGFRLTKGLCSVVVCGLIAGGLASFPRSSADEMDSGAPAEAPEAVAPVDQPAEYVAKLSETDLFAVDAEWVKNATFEVLPQEVEASGGGLAELSEIPPLDIP